MIANQGMVWKIPTPVLSVAAGLYMSEQIVTVTNGDPGATLHYTTNGADPTQADPVVASGGTVTVTQSLTLKVRAWKPGAVASEVVVAAYELKALAPVFTPSSGQYASAQSASLSTATSSATIRYTTDGTEPTPTSSTYTTPITVSDARTLKARTYRSGWTPSDSTAVSYVIYTGTVATPTIAPASGSLTNPILVTLACTAPGATLRFTTDGSEPSVASPTYTVPLLIDRTTTVKARAFMPGMVGSATASTTYSFDLAGQVARPTIVPAGGRFATGSIWSRRDRLGRMTRYVYDPLRRLTATRDPLGRTVSQEYCACGAMEAIVDPNGNRTRWERDAGSRIINEVRANGAETTYAYALRISRIEVKLHWETYDRSSEQSDLNHSNAVT